MKNAVTGLRCRDRCHGIAAGGMVFVDPGWLFFGCDKVYELL
jgi:hypothetical protein